MTEKEIIEGCVQKNVNCQQTLFNKYKGVLMSICLRYAADTTEAEDMPQDTFIKIFSAIRSVSLLQYFSHADIDCKVQVKAPNCFTQTASLPAGTATANSVLPILIPANRNSNGMVSYN